MGAADLVIHRARVWVFGDDLDTDAIAPSQYLMRDPDQGARHCLEDVDPTFASNVRTGDAFVAGTYELAFEAGAYFDAAGLAAGGAGPKFLDTVILRFGIAHADQHYHVTLRCRPNSGAPGRRVSNRGIGELGT